MPYFHCKRDVVMHHFRRLIGKIQSSSASAEKLKREQNYMKHGAGVLEALLALCNGNCRIPLRYFTATEIESATQHSEMTIEEMPGRVYKLLVGSLDNRLVLVRFYLRDYKNYSGYQNHNFYRDIAITCQMSHLKNVLRLIGCCLEFEDPVMVYEYVEAITLYDLLFNKLGNNHDPVRKSILSWGSRLRIANDVASALAFLHSEFTTPIIFRNLKPSKVIIDQNNGVAKLYDFSLSVSLPPGELQVEEDVYGTFGYVDPEYCKSGILTQKSDVYSFGVVLLVLLTGKKVMMDVHDMITNSFQCVVNIEETNNVRDIMVDVRDTMVEVRNVVDPDILEENGTGIQQQLEDYFDLVKKCTLLEREDRPDMIDVARELRRIQNCFRAFNLAHN